MAASLPETDGRLGASPAMTGEVAIRRSRGFHAPPPMHGGRTNADESLRARQEERGVGRWNPCCLAGPAYSSRLAPLRTRSPRLESRPIFTAPDRRLDNDPPQRFKGSGLRNDLAFGGCSWFQCLCRREGGVPGLSSFVQQQRLRASLPFTCRPPPPRCCSSTASAKPCWLCRPRLFRTGRQHMSPFRAGRPHAISSRYNLSCDRTRRGCRDYRGRHGTGAARIVPS